jgi:hypothetical protein
MRPNVVYETRSLNLQYGATCSAFQKPALTHHAEPQGIHPYSLIDATTLIDGDAEMPQRAAAPSEIL